MYTDDRNAYREMFFTAWQKHQKKLPLEAVEAQVVDIIIAHPEYHTILDNPKKFANQEFEVEENPFLHMSLHISIREQLSLDRPAGIKEIHQNLIQKYQNAHDAEHHMTTVLGQIMYETQKTGKMPEEDEYLRRLREVE